MHFKPFKIIDSHIHFPHYAFAEPLVSILAEAGVEKLAVVCTPDEKRFSLLPDALYLKGCYPGRVYLFVGLDISPLLMTLDNAGETFARYVDVLAGLGADGIKMLEGKAEMRKRLPIPDFDGPVYAPYWEKLAERQMPLIFHVNDPEEFWDEKKIPSWAREMGWYYGDGTYIDNEAQYRQVLNVLDRHPDLKVIFAHFFFLSAQLERLADYLDRYPNMHVDLTPGIEMYFNFAVHPQKTRDFFIKYQDRIVYGTDIGAQALLADTGVGIEAEESLARIEVVRGFLEKEGPFQLTHEGFLFGGPQARFLGIHLPDQVLEKIYHQNFERFAGAVPKLLDNAAILEECQRLEAVINTIGAVMPGMTGDTSSITKVRDFFSHSI